MAKITITYALLLLALGVGFFFYTGGTHYTALIPAAFGFLFFGLGILSLVKPSLNKHLMHAAAMLAVLAIAGSASGVVAILKNVTGGAVAASPAATEKTMMFFLSVAFLAMCVRSFIMARRARKIGA
ncbi:hypothetical protein BH09SUM1_BH09SUM1_20670 [soil metagenome]